MEWRKVSKNTIILLICLFGIQVFFFLYTLNIKEQRSSEFGAEPYILYNDEYIEENKQYITGYHDSIADIISRADAMGGISIFAKEDSFSDSNLQKTKEDFKRVLNVEPVAFDDVFLKHYFAYDYINLFVVIGSVFVAFALVDNKKRGLRCILYSSVNGRGRLVINKIVALLKWDTIIVTAFYIGTLIVSAIKFDGDILGCLNHPIQSVSEFAKIPYEMSIGMFLLLYLFVKLVIVFIISLIVWLIIFCVDNTVISIGFVGVIGTGTYIIDRFVGTNSPVNYIRYCNIWYLIKDISIFAEYKNLNWFESAVNKNVYICIFIAVICLICTFMAVLVGLKRYPCSSKVRKNTFILKFLSKIKTFMASLPEKFSVGMLEWYKLFIKQKGLVVVILLFGLWLSQMDLQQVIHTKEQDLYYEFMDNYEGVKSVESEAYIDNLRDTLEKLDIQYEQLHSEYKAGTLTADQWFAFSTMYLNFESERIFLKQIEEQSEYLDQLKENKGIEGWYVNVYGYNHLFAAEDTYGNMALIFSVILICSGLFAVEKKSGTVKIIRGSSEGRLRLFITKLKVVILSAIALFSVATIIEIFSISYVYGLSGFGAPVQSVYMLDFVPFECSMATFVILMYLSKLFVLLCLAVFVSVISIWIEQKKTIIASLIVCAPSLLSLMGLVGFENYSIISVMSIGPMMLRISNVYAMLAIIGAMGAVGLVSLLHGHRKWCNT